MFVDKDGAERIVAAFHKVGLRAKIVGSVAERGFSIHDLDLAVQVWQSKVQYSRYLEVMRNLGFTMTAGAEDHLEHNLEEWQKDGLVVDIWMVEEEEKG